MTSDARSPSANSPAEQRVWKTLNLLQVTAEYFKKKGLETPRLDAEILLAHTLGCKRLDLYVHFDRPVPPDKVDAFREVVRQRSASKPVKYILGKCEFMSREFIVNESVLIPRPETEVVVETAIEKLRAMTSRPEPLIVDVGTGSGNIAITLALEFPQARVIATDLYAEALAVARSNAEKHGVGGRMSLLQGDMLDVLSSSGIEGAVDLIISNPPYVAEGDLPSLAPEIRLYEPVSALIAGPDGLSAYRKLVPEALKYLRPGGWLVLELGRGQFPAVRELTESTEGYEEISAVKDMLKIDRAFCARRK